MRSAGDENRPAQHRGIAGKILLPHGVAQHDDGVASFDAIFFGQESPPDGGVDAERREIVPVDERQQLDLRRRAPLLRDRGDLEDRGDQAREAARAVAKVDIVRVRHERERRHAAPHVRSNRQPFGGPMHRQRPEQQIVGEAEHRHVRPGAERDRDHGDRGEARVACKDARAMPGVVCQASQPAPAGRRRRADARHCR